MEVLKRRPRVLALGEAHAQKAAPNVSSATAIFSERLLPLLSEREPHASDLVLELVATAGACDPSEQEVQRNVEREVSPVSAPQAASNQNEFVALGHRAKNLGLMPWLLRPSCEELKHVANAGPDSIQAMLELIRTLMQDRAERLLVARPEPSMIVIYGGALHNDLVPRAGRENWSFGPALDQKTDGHYVELDLIVPELIRDSEAWRSLPWVAHYDSSRLAPFAVLFEPSPRAYVLVFPHSSPKLNDRFMPKGP